MVDVQDTMPKVGTFDIEVFSSARGGRVRCSQFHLHCDAIALHAKEILLLSVVGPETAVKALTAGLRSSTRDQQRLEYSAHVTDINEASLIKCPAGYQVHRSKLDYDLWHVLCLAKREGFMPVVTDETLWQVLQSNRFTTPLLREWVPWLFKEMKKQGVIVESTQVGCRTGLLLADNDKLDKLVTTGIQQGYLPIGDHAPSTTNSRKREAKNGVNNLDDYLVRYGKLLGKQAEQSLEPLHVPGRDALPNLDLIRRPFEAQAHVIEAARQALCRQKCLMIVGEMGSGKSLMGIAAIHAHAAGRPYRALVFCPGQLVNKWQREIVETIEGAEVIQIESWKTLLSQDPTKKPPSIQWFIIARDRAKLGAKWQPAYHARTHLVDGFISCPNCGGRLVDEKREPLLVGQPGKNGQAGSGLWKRRSRCEWILTDDVASPNAEDEEASRLVPGCGSPLWQMNGEIRRYEPALYIKRRLRHFFKYLIIDECHEEKGADTAQGHAIAALAASCRKVIALTGTLIGGYAEHLRPLLFRLSPGSLIQEGLGWSNATAFNERYGRIETRITEKSGGRSDCDNRMSRGSKATIKTIRPGIMPPLFGRHLIDKAVFLGLNEIAHNLPTFTEECLPIQMDKELAAAYRHEVEEPLVEAIKEMMKRRDRRLLGAMLQTLLAYPDFPFDWGPIGYWKSGKFVTVTEPPNLALDVIRRKEQALLDLVSSEKRQGRQVWVYVQFTDKHDVEARLEGLLRDAKIRVDVLRSSVPLNRREDWIAKHAPRLDVVISHPRLVETGLDLFDKGGLYNFPTIAFYETGYNLFTLRQASRRSWRIGQAEPCRVVYFYYEGTMQDRALALMGKKLTAAQALEGKFSTEGLVAMAGEDANVEIALARSLVNRIDQDDVRRLWGKVSNLPENRVAFPLIGSASSSWFKFPENPSTIPIRQKHPPNVLAGSVAEDGTEGPQEIWLF